MGFGFQSLCSYKGISYEGGEGVFLFSELLDLHQIDSIACKRLRIVETVPVYGARAVALKRGFLRKAKLAVVPHLRLFNLP